MNLTQEEHLKLRIVQSESLISNVIIILQLALLSFMITNSHFSLLVSSCLYFLLLVYSVGFFYLRFTIYKQNKERPVDVKDVGELLIRFVFTRNKLLVELASLFMIAWVAYLNKIFS